MLNILQILFLLLCLFDQKFVTAPKNLRPPPGNPRWYGWAEDIVNKHLTNMTEELLKDTNLKLEQVKQIQISYMHTMSYELGTLTAYIQEDFAHMLAIYRECADLKNFVNEKHTLYQILQAYHIIQGDYNKIRLGKNQFYEVLEKHQKIREERNELRKKLLEGMMGSGGRPRGRKALRTNNTILDHEERWMDSIDDYRKAQHRESVVVEGMSPRHVLTKTTHKRLWRHRDEQFGGKTDSNF